MCRLCVGCVGCVGYVHIHTKFKSSRDTSRQGRDENKVGGRGPTQDHQQPSFSSCSKYRCWRTILAPSAQRISRELAGRRRTLVLYYCCIGEVREFHLPPFLAREGNGGQMIMEHVRRPAPSLLHRLHLIHTRKAHRDAICGQGGSVGTGGKY